MERTAKMLRGEGLLVQATKISPTTMIWRSWTSEKRWTIHASEEAVEPSFSLERVLVEEMELGIVIVGLIFGRRCAFARGSGRGGLLVGRRVGSKALEFWV